MNPLGGEFSEAPNWDQRQIPSESDDTFFNLGSMDAYTVLLTSSQAGNRLLVRNDSLILSGRGQENIEYALGSTAAVSVVVGVAAGDVGQLAADSLKLTAASTTIGRDAESDGTLTVSGASAAWNTAGLSRIGWRGMGSLQLQDGATAASGAVLVGGDAQGANGMGTAVVSGAQWSIAGEASIGVGGSGYLIVDGGATLTSGAASIGVANGSIGVAELVGAGTTWTASSLAIGGSSSSGGGNGELVISDAAQVAVTGAVRVWKSGRLTVHSGRIDAAVIELQDGTIAGGGVLSAPVSMASGRVDAQAGATLEITKTLTTSGTLEKVGKGTLRITGAQSHSVSSSLRVQEGTVELGSDAGSSQAPNLSITVADGAELRLSSPQHLTSIALGDAGSGAICRIESSPGAGPIVAQSLSMTDASQLDVGRGAVVLRAGADRAALLDWAVSRIASARDSALAWEGPGITSSAAGQDSRTGVIAMINDRGDGLPLLQLLDGEPVSAGDLVIAYGRNGDTNLDGRVNADDYFRIDSGFLRQPARPDYRDGDFNYDGKVDADDYFLIDASLLDPAPAAYARTAAVPEVSTGAFLLIGSTWTGLRRSRRRR